MPDPSSSDAADAHTSLFAAVRRADEREVERWGRTCKQRGLLDARKHEWAHRGCALHAPPHLLAAYRLDAAVLEELLPHLADQIDDHAARWCRGCETGPTALQLACSRGAVACVRVLLRLGSDPALPFCFDVDAADEPASR